MEKELGDLRVQGLDGWLLKPPNLDQLAQVVAQALDRPQRSRGEISRVWGRF
jgi:hypothetical protein